MPSDSPSDSPTDEIQEDANNNIAIQAENIVSVPSNVAVQKQVESNNGDEAKGKDKDKVKDIVKDKVKEMVKDKGKGKAGDSAGGEKDRKEKDNEKGVEA